LKILWSAYYNSEIDWRIEEVKMIRYSEECKKQWRPRQGKLVKLEEKAKKLVSQRFYK